VVHCTNCCTDLCSLLLPLPLPLLLLQVLEFWQDNGGLLVSLSI
jgi:hypothetical protein